MSYTALLYWRGHGSLHHGDYWLVWRRNAERESMLYEVYSRKTGKAILRREVF